MTQTQTPVASQKLPAESFKGYKIPRPRGFFYNAFLGNFRSPSSYLAKGKAKAAINRGASTPEDLMFYGMERIHGGSYSKALEMARFLSVNGYTVKAEYLRGEVSFAIGKQHFSAAKHETSLLHKTAWTAAAQETFGDALSHFKKISGQMNGIDEAAKKTVNDMVNRLPGFIKNIPSLIN